MTNTGFDDRVSPGVRLWPGVAMWLVVCVAAVAVRGIRWDENYEFAQILADRVLYPAGHPLALYARSVFSGQTWLTTALVALGGGPVLVCGLRNVCYLLASVLPVYLFATRLTGRSRWGHVAALLTLEGILLEFDGSYPMGVWPELYSNGHVGEGWALLTLFALADGRWRMAGLLGALLPAVHVGQAPVLFLLFGGYALAALFRQQYEALRQAVAWAVPGVFLCFIIYLATRANAQAPVTNGPYAVTGDAAAIWQGFVANADPHRRFPPGNAHVALVGGLLLTGLAIWRNRLCHLAGIYRAIFYYITAVALTTWIILLVHILTRPSPPVLLLQWLPYRLVNHVAPLMLAVVCGVLCSTPKTSLILLAALLGAAVRPLLVPILGPEIWRSYVFAGDGILFGLYGAAFVTLLFPVNAEDLRRAYPTLRGACLFLSVMGLGAYHQFGAACMALGAVAAAAVRPVGREAVLRRMQHVAVVALACAVSVLPMLQNQWRHRESLGQSDFERQVATVLADEAAPDSPLAGPPETYALQARIGHAVLVDAATGSYLTYMPRLGPAIQQMYEDWYGIRFDRGGQPLPWDQVWSRRSEQEWRHLAEHYNVTFLLAPAGLSLRLPESARVLESTETALYRLR